MTIEKLQKGIKFAEKAKIASLKMEEAIEAAREIYNEIKEVENLLSDYKYIDAHNFADLTSLSLKASNDKNIKGFKESSIYIEVPFDRRLVAFQKQMEELGDLKETLEAKLEKQQTLVPVTSFQIGDLIESHKPLKYKSYSGGNETNVDQSFGVSGPTKYSSNLKIETKFTIGQLKGEQAVLFYENERTSTYRKALLVTKEELNNFFTVVEARNDQNTETISFEVHGADRLFGPYPQEFTFKNSKGETVNSDLFTFKQKETDETSESYSYEYEVFLVNNLDDINEVVIDASVVKGSWLRGTSTTDGIQIVYKKNKNGEFKFHKNSRLQRTQMFLSKERTLEFK